MAGRSPSYRPFKQPGSPRVETTTTSMAAQSRLRPGARQNSSSTTANGPGSLRLPGLPRFHPANFPSAHSSLQTTPTAGLNSPQPPMSPRSQQRQYSDGQRTLMSYQREYYSQQVAHKRNSSNPNNPNPTSPKLMPLAGSPGPVTPMMLESEADGYLTAGSGAATHAERAEYVERVIREQVEGMSRGASSPGGIVRSQPVTPLGSC